MVVAFVGVVRDPVPNSRHQFIVVFLAVVESPVGFPE